MNRSRTFKKRPQPLKLAQWLFLAEALLAMVIIYTPSAGAWEEALARPEAAAALLGACAGPFCFLYLRDICARLEAEKEEQLGPLWLLLASQAMGLHYIMLLLLAYGIYRQYGNEMIGPAVLRSSKKSRRSMAFFLPVLLLYGVVLFVKVRVWLP